MNSRIVFLDYDGVVNTPMWNAEGTHCSYGWAKQGKVNNFQAVQWLSEACQKFGYDIVVSSTWRMWDNYKECLINGGLREGIEVLGKTPEIRTQCRGFEIKTYLEEHPEIQYYVIVDDEADMLPEQIGHFILTDGDVGFTIKDFKKFEEIFNKDHEHGGSFPDRKQKDYRRFDERARYEED
jgi:hypothetical protein